MLCLQIAVGRETPLLVYFLTMLSGVRGSMGKTPVRGVHEGRRDASHTVIFVGRAERPGIRHQDRCATVCAQTSAGKAPPARSATETDRAASRPSHRAVAAGKQRRGRASRALRIPADDAAFPCVISIRFQSFLNFVLDLH